MASLTAEGLQSPRYDAVRRMSYLALDVPDWNQASRLVDAMGPAVDGYKVGLQLFHGDGRRALDELFKRQKRVFLDVKLHDIPNTVAGALRAIGEWPLEMVNVHATGGVRMMAAAASALQTTTYHPLLIAVTVLTSLSDEEIGQLGWPRTETLVPSLAKLANECGLNGVVASAWDVPNIRRLTSPNFEIVVPGTRPLGADRHDQSRVMTPAEAVRAGATRLVLGRAVTASEHPIQAVQQIWDEMVMGMDSSSAH